MIKYIDLMKKVYKKMNVEKEIIKLIYNNTKNDKFVFDKFSQKTKLSTEYLKVIN
jgi:hypothetical protein